MSDSDDAVALTIRLPSIMREEFARLTRETGTTASECLRNWIQNAIRGRVPGPRYSPSDEARHIIQTDGKVGMGPLVSEDQAAGFPLACTERAYQSTVLRLAKTILAQDAALRRVGAALADLEATL